MKCKHCDRCHEVTYTRHIPNFGLGNVTVHECWGVKEPFEIPDINHECYEYPEKRDENPKQKLNPSGDGLLIGDIKLGIYVSPTDLVFIKNGVHTTFRELLKQNGIEV